MPPGQKFLAKDLSCDVVNDCRLIPPRRETPSMKPRLFICLLLWLPGLAFSYTLSELGTADDTGKTIQVIPLEATVNEDPAEIRIKSYAPGTFTIFRKGVDDTTWGSSVATGVSLAAEGVWTDTDVTVGALYEYKFVNTAGTAFRSILPTGYILAGIRVDQTLPKGRMAVVVASDVPANLPQEYAQYKADLEADGWTVHEIQVPRAVDYSGLGHGSIVSVQVENGGSGYANGTVVDLTNPAGKRAKGRLTTSGGVITSISIPTGGGGTGFAVGDVLSASGGGTFGSGAYLIGRIDQTQLGLVDAWTEEYGSGYINNDTATMTGDVSGKTAQVRLGVLGGIIFGVTVLSSESGFVNGETLTLSGASAGSGAGPFESDFGGPLQSIEVQAGGSNYVDGSTATIPTRFGSQSAEVTLVANAGVLTAVNVTSGGSGFYDFQAVNLSNLTPNTSGSGLSVLSVDNSGAARAVVITAGGSGYLDNEEILITGATSGATAKGTIIAPEGSISSIGCVLPNTFIPGETLTLTASGGGGGASAIAGASTVVHLPIRSAVQAIAVAYPSQLKTVVTVGRVPVARSGLDDWYGADGHGNQAPYATDAFYADLDGELATHWTDTASNNGPWYNVPADNQFNPQRISQVGNGRVELGFGRIDMSVEIKMEWEALRNYFKKLHRYKTASPDFRPGRRVADRFSYPNVRDTSIQSMPSVVGMENIDVLSKDTPPSVNKDEDSDSAYSAIHGPYLFYFKGGGPPGIGDGGRAVFWTGMQSHYGYWHKSGLMAKQLAQDSFALSWTWDIWGLRYIYHRMGMGLDAADMMKQSINNQGWSASGTYSYKFTNRSNGDFHGSLYMNHIGDPALRLFMIAPPSKLSVVNSGSQAALSWTASPEEGIIGYHIYRKPVGNGPYTRLTFTPQPATTYLDSSVSAGNHAYMVRAVRLETTGSGTFLNPSLGIVQSLDYDNPPEPLIILDGQLSEGHWNTPYSETLLAEGGVPQFAWSVASGSLPPGLFLSEEGVISGSPTAQGLYSFTVQAIDQAGVTAQQQFEISAGSNEVITLTPEATSHTNKAFPTNSYGSEEVNLISGHPAYKYETFQRYNLSGLNLNNGFVKATVQFFVAPETAANTYSLVQGQLLRDVDDGWVEAGREVSFETEFANNGANKIRLTSYGHGFQTGSLVAIEGFSHPAANGLFTITRIDDDTFDIPVTYNASYVVDPADASASAVSLNYNNRPTTFHPTMPVVAASSAPMANTLLEVDVTDYVAETLANDPTKRLSLRLFTTAQQTVAVGSRRAYGVGRPRLVIQTTDAPAITFVSPTITPASLHLGSALSIQAAVTPIVGREDSLTLTWSQISGPGTAEIGTPNMAGTTAVFPVAGEYTLRLNANDGVLTSFKDLRVRVLDVPANTSPAVGDHNGLLVRLPFDENTGATAVDVAPVAGDPGSLTSIGNPVTLPTWQPGQGRVGGGLRFDGTGQRVEIPDSTSRPLDGLQKLTLSAWVKIVAQASVSTAIIAKRTTASASSNSYTLSITSSRRLGVTMNGSNVVSANNNNTQLAIGEWYHVAMVFDGTLSTHNVKLYLNGVPELFGHLPAVTTISRHATSPLRVGDHSSVPVANGGSFNGLIDEVRVYDRALSQQEVANLFVAAPANLGPQILLGESVEGNVGEQISLGASVIDDGLPGPLSLQWTLATGPGSVSFADPSEAATTVTASTAGDHTLRLLASDGAITTWKDLLAVVTGASLNAGYLAWLDANNLPTDGSGLGAPHASARGDGIANAIKYALGLDADAAGYAGRLSTEVLDVEGEEYLSLTYVSPDPALPGVGYAVKVGGDLAAWSEDVSVVSDTVEAGLRTITVRDTQPISPAHPKRFIRLEVNLE